MAKRKAKTARPAAAPLKDVAPNVGTAVPGVMKVEIVEIASLTSDPRNARLHGEKNMASIVHSLRRYGQQKTIVVDADGVVLAGNGTLEAAKQLGWKQITINRSSLRGAEARAYALADNRSGELAEWDLDELNRTLSELDEAAIDMEEVGFSDDDLAALDQGDFDLAHGFAPRREKPAAEPKIQEIEAQYKVIITCKSEAEQAEAIRWCETKGMEYKAPSV